MGLEWHKEEGQEEPGRWWSGPWEGGQYWASPRKMISVTLVVPVPASAQAIGPDVRVKPLNCASWELLLPKGMWTRTEGGVVEKGRPGLEPGRACKRLAQKQA